ncbi:ABC transporter ATP-binding protein [Streptomyces sp. NPDC059460]|uniref:ABC transporter ATP-binding protein n=1 Tax=Streptomyces sp. NPDC059460 TaxID=3346840 RepID=UPI00368B2439
MSAVLRAQGLGKRYKQRWALQNCDLDVPAGRVVGLVGPNGAGKSTLLKLASGMLTPTAGTIEVCGGRPAAGVEQLAKVGFVAQDTPIYATLSVADHLDFGKRLNLNWDDAVARDRIRRLGLDPKQRAGKLSGGQRAQLALTLGIAKRPELLILDEPVAALDPLARREFMQDLMEAVAEHELSVVLSPTWSPTWSGPATTSSSWSTPGCRWPVTSTTWSPATTGSPDRAGTRTRSRPVSTSSPPATPTGRPLSWCAPTPRSTIRPGPSARSVWKTSSWPT